jgi:L,D-transpeptidase catalytic domain
MNLRIALAMLFLQSRIGGAEAAGRPRFAADAPTLAATSTAQRSVAPHVRYVRPFTSWRAEASQPGRLRDRDAVRRRDTTVRALFREAAVAFPPAQVYFRVFKAEAALEVWATGEIGDKMKQVATYGICALSGELGPKRQEGDGQVPEGFYELSFLKNDSAYHLAMRVNYPNRFDRTVAVGPPGGAIMIHGNCVSIGCLAMSDERIEELWTIVRPIYARNERVTLHIFPAREIAARSRELRYLAHRSLWSDLDRAQQAFKATQRLPNVSFDAKGRYLIDVRPP